MDSYEFWGAIAHDLASFAWPVAVLGIAIMLRRPLVALLPLLRFRYKDLEASFRLDEAEQEAKLT